MPNANDARIAKFLSDYDDHRTLPDIRLLDLITQLKDDNAYWQIVATTWIKRGRSSELQVWRRLFSADRRNRWHLMKKKDRRLWRGLPNTVVAYRAVAPGEDASLIISWTLNPEVLERLYGKTRAIISRHFKKEQIIAYFDRRREQEIIVL